MKITVVDKGSYKQSKDAVRVSLNSELERTFCQKIDTGWRINIKVAKSAEMTRRKWLLLVREIAKVSKQNKFAQIVVDWSELVGDIEELKDVEASELSEIFAQNVAMANYEFRTYKSKPKEGWNDLREIVLLAPTEIASKLRTGIKKGLTIGSAVNTCRDLANTPGEDMTPKILVRKTRALLRKLPVKVKVLGEKEMKKKKMNGVLTVGRGSGHESQFIVLEYWGKSDKSAPTVLVGKGVTFDSGGIDTKPHPHGCDMMMDMSGGAAAIATITAAAQLKLRKNIVALIPAVENMGDGNSMRPGDIIRMYDGTTVEVGHTDAEGRIILADALTFAQKNYKPAKLIDVATLTGAALAALGERASAIFTTSDQFAQNVLELSEKTGDYAWRLPLWDEYDTEIKGTVADISNITKSRYGGAITAATFLKHFVKDDLRPNYMHIDIAPTMTTTPDEHLAKGAKGSPVRLLVKFLQEA